MTSIEWLVEQFKTYLPSIHQDGLKDKFEQAKEMHKQEIIDAGNSCAMKSKLYADKLSVMDEKALDILINKEEQTFGEDYYNETYQSVESNEMIELPQQNDDVREDDVEKLADEIEIESQKYKNKMFNEEGYNIVVSVARRWGFRDGAKWGYNKAKENTYTEEQVREAIENTLDSIPFISKKPCADSIIKSLKQPK